MNALLVIGFVQFGLILTRASDVPVNHGLITYGHYGLPTYAVQQQGYKGYNAYQLGHQYYPKNLRVETYLKQEFQVPIPKPYPVHVEKRVPVPYPVEVKVPVDHPRPVPVEKPYPVPVEKPVPYPVYKNIPVPVQVPVNVPYPVKVQVQVPQPYPVPVTKNVPYIVRQPVLVEKQVPVYVHQPLYNDNHKNDYSRIDSGYNSGYPYAGGFNHLY